MGETTRVGGPAATLRSTLPSVPGFGAITTAAELVQIGIRSLYLAARHPTEWVRPAIVEVSTYYRRCLAPLFISNGIWLTGFGVVLFGALTFNLGVAEREPVGIMIGFIREVSTWITMMIVAGVAGSAMAADLGARKIRDELDALAVLGVDKFRMLVVPRVMAMVFVAITLPLLDHFESQVVNYVFAPDHLHFTRGVYREAARQNIYPLDYFSSILKHLIMGVFIAVVACQKGLSSKGGAEGVGRAVNETVVLSFLGIWIINSVYNTAFLTVFPNISVPLG